ncbi:MAG: hypothetical protein AB1598_00350 [Thermodesulfobacteriota bacterium]
MKNYRFFASSAGNVLLLFAVIGLGPAVSYADAAKASALYSGEETPLVQYDDDDMVPPMPDVPQAPGPEDIDDPALSGDSVITEPDPPIDQPEPYIIDDEPEVINEPVINEDVDVVNEPAAGGAGAVEDEPEPVVEEPDEAVVNEPDPVVNENTPIIDDE